MFWAYWLSWWLSGKEIYQPIQETWVEDKPILWHFMLPSLSECACFPHPKEEDPHSAPSFYPPPTWTLCTVVRCFECGPRGQAAGVQTFWHHNKLYALRVLNLHSSHLSVLFCKPALEGCCENTFNKYVSNTWSSVRHLLSTQCGLAFLTVLTFFFKLILFFKLSFMLSAM